MGEYGKYWALVMQIQATIGAYVRRFLKRVAVIGLACALPQLAVSQSQCRQALALGLDVSGSVDSQEYRLQIDGLANALESPEVVDKLLASSKTVINLAIYEWSGPGHQRVLRDWTALTSRSVIADIADGLRQSTRVPANPSTGLGRAMLFGAEMLAQRPDCWTHSLDVSGDGQSNSGPRPQDVRQDRLLENVVVNALVIGASIPDRDLTSYFEAYVLHGFGSFTMQAESFKEFETAMIKKLLREVQGVMVSNASPAPTLPNATQ
ncbi:DUF1194 domain-containing protein [Aliiroseovarius marinus]|uniref:DUF1194 domain-containing protein n=1 Tax=Aliiroseovarius marinus TaxID=2500159 RepID=UPI0024958FBA|nr:DUF1194 domain-containing protein [Aliiroseovarius marinus]